jgi:S-adenosylmethionine:tRNA ribosyltransferase-isomerase
MKTEEFYFDLPEKLVAQYPPAERGQSRLMVIDRRKRSFEHRMVKELPDILERGTLAVFNDSRVRRARLFGCSEKSGAKAEFLLLEKLDELSWKVLAKRSKRRKAGERYIIDDISAEICSDNGTVGGGILVLRFARPIDDAWLDTHGHIPLPPYIKRNDAKLDWERYQTIYSREYGSAAAPTAGLHFTEEIFTLLERAGVERSFITLHVGPGTFLPVRAENVEDHKMHEESFYIDENTASRIEKAKAEKRKILAVGTTSLRALESARIGERPLKLQRGKGRTAIFIYPGFNFKVVDALFTNFHTPASTLLMLVSAFAGRDFIFDAYKEAIREGYRFFSYGDACLIL